MLDPVSFIAKNVIGGLLGSIFGGTPDRLKGNVNYHLPPALSVEAANVYEPEFQPLAEADFRSFDPGFGQVFQPMQPVQLSGAQLAAASMFPEQNRFEERGV
tara:strand:- start:213 stop:518 length:306 start_codon:yes stop_codon:yes gene_type:complete